MNMSRLEEQGRAYYKWRDYQIALEFFDRALKCGVSVQLLDKRAACLEKLNDLQAALKDAKKTIQLQREDPTGYLRAGRILAKMEKQSVALEIYTHGLRCIKHVGRGYESQVDQKAQLLHKVHAELLDQLSPHTGVDPLTILPRELAECVLGFLTFKQRVNACLVSKGWSQFMRSTPNLWQHLDLRDGRRKVKNAFISRAINAGRHRLTAATLHNLFDFDKALNAIVRTCPLQELILLETGVQSENLVDILRRAKHLKVLKLSADTIIGCTALSSVLEVTSNTLETFECSMNDLGRSRWPGLDDSVVRFPNRCENMTAISLTTIGWAFSWDDLKGMNVALPNLRALTMQASKPRNRASPRADFTEFAYLERLTVRHSLPGDNKFKLPSTLTQLCLSCYNSTRGIQGAVSDIWLPRLKELDVTLELVRNAAAFLAGKSWWESDLTAQDGTVVPSQLESLSLVSGRLSPGDLECLLSHTRLRDLQHFALKSSAGCKDDSIAVILAKLKGLRCLDLSESEITGVGVKEAANSGHIKQLILNDCGSVSADAVEWARSQGVAVELRKSNEAASGGRLVRC